MNTSYLKFEIKAKLKNLLEEKISKINSKANKLGIQEYSFSFKEPFQKDNEVYIPVIIVGLSTLKINDYSFIAALKHLSDGQVLCFGQNVPEEFKNSKSECDHCKVNRSRNKTYLLYNELENKYIQVGSSCIEDFFKGSSIKDIEKTFDIISEINSLKTNLEKININKSTYLVHQYLSVVSAIIRDYSWSPKNSDYPTYQRAFDELNSIEITAFEEIQARNAVDWVNNLSAKDLENNYFHNIKTIIDHGFVTIETAPLAASIINSFLKNKPKVENISQFVGNIGDKSIFDLKFSKKFEFFSKFGTTYLYSFEDNHGNYFTWKTSKFINFEDNKKYVIVGTIKNHILYKEKYKQTELTRCKVENIY